MNSSVSFPPIRIGQGYDVHAFGEGDHIMLAGVRVPHSRGVLAHSDGDVALHALCDALLSAAGKTVWIDDEAQMLARAGYAVLRLNFRGSGNYGRAHMQAGAREWGGAMQDDLTDATQWAIKQGIADPGRICIVGGSYGGYAALMGTIRTPDTYRCAASINGVNGLFYGNPKSQICGEKYCPAFHICRWRR